jgi:hypothetical protein
VRRRREARPAASEASPASYYGRAIVKPSPWEADIPAYLFAGGLAAGSSLLAAGADLTGRPALRRSGRIGALAAISVSLGALVHDLGRPTRFLNMLRTIKPTSPMSVGTWILSLYGPLVAVAAAGEVVPWVRRPGRAASALSAVAGPAGLAAAVVAPTVAAYTAVLLADTATPSWHDAHRQLPFVFVGSAAAAAGGLGMIAAPVSQAGPARRLAVGGALLELLAERRMEADMGITAEPLHDGKAGMLMATARALTAFGALAVLGARDRRVAMLAGVALLGGSACTRFGVFEGGQQSARDPRYTVAPQRGRRDQRPPQAPSEPARSVV